MAAGVQQFMANNRAADGRIEFRPMRRQKNGGTPEAEGDRSRNVRGNINLGVDAECILQICWFCGRAVTA
jgi:hypothetical protein